jgi:hypothetical protein
MKSIATFTAAGAVLLTCGGGEETSTTTRQTLLRNRYLNPDPARPPAYIRP